MNIIKILKPDVPRRALLFIAAVVWTIAGSVLLCKGFGLVINNLNHLFLTLAGSAFGGILFYEVMFSRISRNHTRRIINLKNDYSCFFAFFNFRSYILMSVMITMGIFIRKSGIIAPYYLSVLYITMGVPLFLSAFRLYYYGIFYEKTAGLKY